jgi:hypothetical protein
MITKNMLRTDNRRSFDLHKSNTLFGKFDENKARSLMDVIGSSVVDIVYNHMYDKAVIIHQKTQNGIAECYRTSICEYINDIGTAKFYNTLLNTLHHFTRYSTSMATIAYTDCIDLYSSLFIPQMYIRSLTSEQRLNYLSMVLGKVIKEFCNIVLQSHLRSIIDDHMDPINIEVLQDEILQLFLEEREHSIDEFIRSQKQEAQTIEAEKDNSSIKPKSISKIAEAFKKSINEITILKKKNTKLMKQNAILVNQLKQAKNILLSQIEAYKDQTYRLDQLKLKQSELVSSTETKEETKEDDNDEEYDEEHLFTLSY